MILKHSDVILSAITPFFRTTLFIACTPLAGSSTEHVFYIMKTARAKPKVGGITQNIDLGYACFQEKYYRVCIARAAVNESVCQDSHAEHVQFATAAVSV